MLQLRIELPMDAVALVCQRYEVTELAVFGAALREDCPADAGVEFLIEFAGGGVVELLDLLSVQDELTAAIGRRVSLVPKAGLLPHIRDHAAAHSLVIYAG